MRVAVATIVLLATWPFASVSQANERLAQEKQCMQCHKVKEAFAGPSFHDIAQKYQKDPKGVQRITAIVRKGSDATGGPHWGKASMPGMAERPVVSQAEARQLASWVLKQ